MGRGSFTLGADLPSKGGGREPGRVGGGDRGTDLYVEGQAVGDSAGYTLTNLGDLDSDGSDEVAVGAPGHTDGETGEGVVYILFGR